MFTRVAAIFVLALPLLVSAGILPPASDLGHIEGRQSGGNCSTGEEYCCNDLKNADDASTAPVLGALGIAVQDITGQVGLTCTPITALIGVDGMSCSRQTVCCTGRNYNGAATLGCTPINANL